MMMFRIIKKENASTHYVIQKKFLFWWFNYGIKTHYYTYTDWNAEHKRMPVHMAHITKRVFLFDTQENAEKYLSKIKNPYSRYYMGDLIESVFNNRTWEEVFINRSFIGRWYGGVGYEYSDTLDGLKAKIALRKSETKISIVA